MGVFPLGMKLEGGDSSFFASAASGGWGKTAFLLIPIHNRRAHAHRSQGMPARVQIG